MVERERFGQEELAEVLTRYDIGLIRSAKEFARGSRRSPKLLLETATGRYLLKRRAVGRNDPAKVAFAHALQAHLRRRGVAVPALIDTCDDQRSLVQVGAHVYELFEFVEGERYDSSLEQTARAGEALALFHRAVADFHGNWTPPSASYHNAPNVRAGLNAIPTVASSHDSVQGREAELLALTQRLHEAYDDAAARAAAAGLAQWPHAILHGDWHPGNLLFWKGKVHAILDFDSARSQTAVIDLAYGMLQFSILRDSSAPEQWPDFFDESRMRRFFTGYARLHPLPAERRRVIPDLMSQALISEAAVPIAVTGSFGRLPGYGVLQMISRKVRWIQQNSEHLQQWLAE